MTSSNQLKALIVKWACHTGWHGAC